jgi:hypothetical protein
VDFVQTTENFFSVFFGGTFTEHKSPWGIYEIKRLASAAISFSKLCHIVFFLEIIGGYQPDTHWVSWEKKIKKKTSLIFTLYKALGCRLLAQHL